MKCEICGKEEHFTVEPSVYVCNDCMKREQLEQARLDGDETTNAESGDDEVLDYD